MTGRCLLGSIRKCFLLMSKFLNGLNTPAVRPARHLTENGLPGVAEGTDKKRGEDEPAERRAKHWRVLLGIVGGEALNLHRAFGEFEELHRIVSGFEDCLLKSLHILSLSGLDGNFHQLGLWV